MSERGRRLTESWLPAALLLLLMGLPYLLAAVTGSAEAGTSGLRRLHSAAESVYCAPGLTVPGTLLIALVALLALMVGVASRGSGAGWILGIVRRRGWETVAVGVLIAVPFLIAWQTDSSVCTRGRAFFWESIFIDVFILAILAISYNLLFGFAGIVSFGHAAFFGTGAYTVGLLMLHLEWPWWLAILAALATGVLIAVVKGGVGLRIRGLYFALFTLAFAEILFLLAGNRILVGLTGAEDGFTFSVPDWLNMTRNRLFFYYMTLLILVLAYLLVRRLMTSPTGRVLVALRDNEERARMLGFNTFYYKLIALLVAGLIGSGAGILRALSLKGASPNILGLDFTLAPLLMTIIGGQGTFAGPVVGAFLLRLVEQLLRDTVLTVGTLQINIGERWALILGLLFIVIVILFPYGIVGTLQQRRRGG